MQQPSLISITAAALLMQFSILVIIAIGAGFLHFVANHRSPSIAPFIIVLTLVSLAVVFLSHTFSSMWLPIFGITNPIGLGWSTTLLLLFMVDILGVSLIVWRTGGSSVSPFTPIYFIIPPLAIFLRDTLVNIIFYLIGATGLFTANFSSSFRYDWEGKEGRNVALWFVSIACLVLAAVIGWATRPTSIVIPH